MSDYSEFSGSASEAEEEPAARSQEQPEAEPKRIAVPRRPKLNSERVLDNRNGVQKLVEEFRKVEFKGAGHEVADLDLFISTFEKWSQVLYPYGQNILDFAKTVENELAPQNVRMRLMDYRQEYVRQLDATGTEEPVSEEAKPVVSQEELMRKKEENRRMALEKLRQKQMEKVSRENQENDPDSVMKAPENIAETS